MEENIFRRFFWGSEKTLPHFGRIMFREEAGF